MLPYYPNNKEGTYTYIIMRVVERIIITTTKVLEVLENISIIKRS